MIKVVIVKLYWYCDENFWRNKWEILKIFSLCFIFWIVGCFVYIKMIWYILSLSFIMCSGYVMVFIIIILYLVIIGIVIDVFYLYEYLYFINISILIRFIKICEERS